MYYVMVMLWFLLYVTVYQDLFFSSFQTSLENPSIQTHLVLLCCIKRLCIFGPKGAIQIHYYYYYWTTYIIIILLY